LGTSLLDEACSLLVDIAFINDKQLRDRDERRWVQAEDKEMHGKFAPFYRKLRSTVEFLYGSNLDSCVTENDRFTFAELAITCCRAFYQEMACTGRSDPEKFLAGNYDWSKWVDNERIKAFFDRLPSLSRRWGELPVRLGLQLLNDENRQSFTDEPQFGPNARENLIKSFQNDSKARRRFPAQYILCQSGVTKEGVSFISVVPSGLTGDLDDPINNKVVYTIFLESIRQQICQGVGLRCPFWNGECCQSRGFREGFKELLEKTYKITKPWKWPQYWQKPPCLDEVN
jgi:hypothetical protein